MFGNMLMIHNVNPTGMFSYGLSDNINLLNKGLVHLVGINEDKGGDSNGAGKSSLFNAICELLFQENPTGEKGDSVINSVWNRGYAGRIMITNWQGIHYRITYCRKWKDRFYPADNDNNVEYVGTGLFLDKYEDKVWKDFRGASMPETHNRILEAVGMTYQQFISIAYMTHRVGSQFLRGSNKERIDILAGITGIEEWDLILDKARKARRGLRGEVVDLEQKVAYEEGSKQTLVDQAKQYKEFDWLEYIEQLKQNEEIYKTLKKEKQDLIDLGNVEIQKLCTLRDESYNPAKVREINAQIAQLNIKLKELENQLSKLFYVEEDETLKQKYNDATIAVNTTQGELRAFRGETGSILEMSKCPTCGSKISKARKDKILKRVKELETSLLNYTTLQESTKKDLSESIQLKKSENEVNRKTLKDEIDLVRETIQLKLNESQNEQIVYSEYEKQIKSLQGNLATLQSELNSIQNEENQIETKIQQAKTSIEYIAVLEGYIRERDLKIDGLKTEAQTLKSKLDVYVWLIDNIPYIKLHKMSRAMVDISELCNRYFNEMGDTVRLNISSFEEKVSKRNAADVKDLMKSEVKVEIIDGSKNISPKLYSDGEISKISLAVIRALHELARKSGQGCNLMFLDEVFSFVDGNNSQRIAHSLSSFLTKGSVFLTDNSGSVKNLINFNENWVARKKNGQTLLEVGQ